MRRALGMALAGLAAAAGDAPAQAAHAAGRVDTFRVEMGELGGRERTVRVYLPPGYDASDARYPVLYLQDGQNLFAPGSYGDWQVDETLDRLVAAGRTPGIIVVGIDHGGPLRWDEYGPWEHHYLHDWVDSTWAEASEGGEGEDYVRFLANALKPRIDSVYRTRPGRDHTGIGGSSMGALIALYAGIMRPHVFGKVMAMSPAVWFAEGMGPWLSENRLIDLVGWWEPPRDVRFWIDVGTNERSRDTDPHAIDRAGEMPTYPRVYVEGAQAVVQALHARGVPADDINYFVEEGAVHHESAWARRFEEAVLWLYP